LDHWLLLLVFRLMIGIAVRLAFPHSAVRHHA
jgi:hypothetical protein